MKTTTPTEQRYKLKMILIAKGHSAVAVNEMVDEWEDDELYDNVRALIEIEAL